MTFLSTLDGHISGTNGCLTFPLCISGFLGSRYFLIQKAIDFPYVQFGPFLVRFSILNLNLWIGFILKRFLTADIVVMEILCFWLYLKACCFFFFEKKNKIKHLLCNVSLLLCSIIIHSSLQPELPGLGQDSWPVRSPQAWTHAPSKGRNIAMLCNYMKYRDPRAPSYSNDDLENVYWKWVFLRGLILEESVKMDTWHLCVLFLPHPFFLSLRKSVCCWKIHK